MTESTSPGIIRTKVVCVFRNGRRILVADAYDPTKNEWFYCPPGGGVEFGETSEEALRREIREELATEIENPILLGVIENLFTFDGEQGHEIVFIYDARLVNTALYNVDRFTGFESTGEGYNAIWLDIKTIDSKTPPVYPEGLLDMLVRK